MYLYQGLTKDFVEMTLHEILTLYLFFGCYFANFWEIGAVISYIHGVSDVLVMLCKVLSETDLNKTTAFLFMVEIFIWFYTRLMVFPWIIYNTFLFEFPYLYAMRFWSICLSCLCFLHAYWFMMFI